MRRRASSRPRRARSDARWMTGPSASGSENGTPTSSTSAPPRSSARRMSPDRARSGSPAVDVGDEARAPARRAAVRRSSSMRDITRLRAARLGRGAAACSRRAQRSARPCRRGPRGSPASARPARARARATGSAAKACDDSSAGKMPSVRASGSKASSASSSDDVHVLGAPVSRSHACSGPTAA